MFHEYCAPSFQIWCLKLSTPLHIPPGLEKIVVLMYYFLFYYQLVYWIHVIGTPETAKRKSFRKTRSSRRNPIHINAILKLFKLYFWRKIEQIHFLFYRSTIGRSLVVPYPFWRTNELIPA